MHVRDIMQFVSNFAQFYYLSDMDKAFRQQILKRFASRAEGLITADDFTFLTNILEQRNTRVMDTSLDYTFSSTGINAYYIAFAKKIAKATKQTYFQVLMPDVINKYDIAQSTLLDDTQEPHHFYRSHRSVILLSKLSLMQQLKKNRYQLVAPTHPSVARQCSKPFSVQELTRLRCCSEPANYTLTMRNKPDECFDSFWRFLNNKVFVNLNRKNEIPWQYIPALFHLVKDYFTYQAQKQDFNLFRQKVLTFFAQLLTGAAHETNLFYGIQIQQTRGKFKKTFYLLEHLIDINLAKDFKIDSTMRLLASWLYQQNSQLKINIQALEPYYEAPVEDRPIIVTKTTDEEILHFCRCMLVSLLTYPFEHLPFISERLVLWDRVNMVFPEAISLYRSIAPLLIFGKEQELITQYEKIRQKITGIIISTNALLTWLPHYRSKIKWCNLVLAQDLTALAVQWVEPDLILQTALYFNCTSPETKALNTQLLDEIVHTYVSDKNVGLRKFRVNIIFAQFIRNLSVEDSTLFLELMGLYTTCNTASRFLTNCKQHIKNRLSDYYCSTPGFFSESFAVKLSLIKNDSLTLREILQEMTNNIVKQNSRPQLPPASSALTQMMAYLAKLTAPILALGDETTNQCQVNSLDVLNAST